MNNNKKKRKTKKMLASMLSSAILGHRRRFFVGSAILIAILVVLSSALFKIGDARMGLSYAHLLFPFGDGEKTSTTKNTKNIDGSFYFIQLADPQFGVINGYSQNFGEALDWSRERTLFNLALSHVVRLKPKPSFLLISGDMQQYYPKNEGKKNGILANYTNAGYRQAEDVRSALQEALAGTSIPVKLLAGNHDVDDIPDAAALDYYRTTWNLEDAKDGNSNENAHDNKLNLTADHHYSFWQDGVFFIVLNSQFYYDDTELPKGVKDKQTEWFRSQLEQVQEVQVQQQKSHTRSPKRNKLRNIVVLTHIAPFGGSPNEKHGFGNWQEADRAEVLDIATSFDLWPTLWLCGHFHGNGRYYGNSRGSSEDRRNENKNVEIVISNSVTSPMEWDGVPAHETYTAAKLSEIVSIDDPGVAFGQYIAPDLSRVSGGPSKAGLRIFEFFKHDGSYRHKWFSLDDITTVDAINDESMVGATWVDNPWPGGT